MLGLFRKRREKKPPSAWMTWLVLAIVIYALVANNTRTPTPDQPENSAETTIDINPKEVLQLDSYADKLLPQRVEKLAIKDTLVGSGAVANCGQHISIAYKTITKDGTETSDKASFTIGEGKEPVFEQGIVGMAKGGERSIYPPERDKQYDVELLSISPDYPDNSAFRIFGDKQEIGKLIGCGMPVKLKIILTSIEGKRLYESKEPITFTTGKSQVFLGLEQGVLGMKKGGFRSLIVPPAFQKTLSGNPPAIDFPLPKKQTVLVDIESVP